MAPSRSPSQTEFAMLRSFRNWKVVVGLIASTNLIGSGAALAQGWGEQRPLQFGIVGAGGSAMTAEIYRRQFLLGSQQLGVAQVNNFNGGGGGGGGGISGVTGSAQASSQLNNSNQVTFSAPVTVEAGGTLYLNTGPQGGSTQTSTGTSQGSTNSQSTGGVSNLAGNQTASNAGNGQVVQGGAAAVSGRKSGNFLNTNP
ncbi:hypothetical protein AMST5_01104 [freshwater sediment metagenome]|uniref:Uncharacterized protein n=1 Tax=freshwater sediment metagenome TaxID=556182 RepID=A0AA48R9C8_9ZZZZ